MNKSDKEICELLSYDISKGLELLFKAYYNNLVLWADSFLHDIQQSEDLVQELLITLWTKKEAISFTPETLSVFLFKSVKNNCLKKIGKKDVFRIPVRLEDIVLYFEEYQNKKEQLLQLVQTAVEQLPPRSKEVMHAVFSEGLKYREVAEKLGVSVSTVKTLLGNAVKKIREQLGREDWSAFLFFYAKNLNRH